ncbi:hypothetical protein BGZ81_003346 [Podila clonocystis]|nr:hypothetical protein BGZ81_003346 [Podila clonocystis]
MSAPGTSKHTEPLPGQEYATPVPPLIDLSGKPKLPFTRKELDALSMPKVLISGGGIGGLTLALLLYKANIPFIVLERAKEIKPLERIILGKRVLSFVQNDKSVLVRCSDSSTYQGEILVGADGAYSAVRQQLYKELKVAKKLPSSDDVSLPFSCVCLVGQTVELDPEEFPDLKEEYCQFNSVLGQSTMCTVIQFLDKYTTKKNDSFRNSEWGPEAAEALAREVRPFKVPGGKDGRVLTLGDYLDKTPKDLLSKVMLEEIVFDTWFNGRTVLLGDACHKMNPAGALGAVTAIHDAVTLANWLSTLRLATEEDITNVFKKYRAERFPVAKANFVASQGFVKNLGKNVLASVIRGMIKRLPPWLWRQIVLRQVQARHQASFLPLEKDRSKFKPLHQPSLHKTLPILKKLVENPAILTTESSAPVAALTTALGMLFNKFSVMTFVLALLSAASDAQDQPSKTVVVTSNTHFCLFFPPFYCHGGIAANEHRAVAFCTQPHSPGVFWPIPVDFIRTAHFRSNTQRKWIQVTGRIRRQKYCLSSRDQGGQNDKKHPPGAKCAGYPYFVQLMEPNENIFCIRCCMIESDCPTNRDTEGCRAVIRGDYS